MVETINSNRKNNPSLPQLIWKDEWHDIAFSISVNDSENVHVLSDLEMNKAFEKMNTAFLSMDWEVQVTNAKALIDDPV